MEKEAKGRRFVPQRVREDDASQQILMDTETGMPALVAALARQSSQSENRLKCFFAVPIEVDGEDQFVPVMNPQGFRLEMN